MKTIGIIAAMDEEIELIKSMMEIAVTKLTVGAEFHMGLLCGKSVTLVKCGVGKVNAAVCTQALIDLFAVDYVVNTGIAGAIYKDMKIGDIVISSEAVQHDFDCVSFGYKLGEIPWMPESVFKADEDMLAAAKRAVTELGLEKERGVFTARIASGDIFVASKAKKKEIWDNFAPYCVEMEGAAIAQACYLNKIPFVIIRSISDSAEKEIDVDFQAFSKLAAKISQELTEKIVEYI